MKYKIITLLIALLALLGWYLKPFYDFYAYQNKAPMYPWGQVLIPAERPQQSEVFDIDYQSVAQQASDLLAAHSKHIYAPGITAAVAINDQLVWAASAGWADIETKQPMRTDSQLRIGSTSKAVTAAGLARLIQAGKVTLDTSLGEVYASLPNPTWRPITLRQLASHMSGMPHYNKNTELLGLLEFMRLDKHYAEVGDALKLFDESQLLFPPGSQFEYSSLGTVVISDVIAQRADMRYQNWMVNEVFTPLQLHHTVEEQQASKLVTFYWQSPTQQEQVRTWRAVDLSQRLAGGGWVSTSKDLAMFGQGFMREEFIGNELREQFWTPQTLNNGEVNPQNYALGWRQGSLSLANPIGDIRYYHHGGVSRGAQGFLLVVPQYHLSMAVNINTKTDKFSDFSAVCKELVSLFVLQQFRLRGSCQDNDSYC
ncbi:serine hydrolase domain-containing protein [Pseudoalteromonas fenneropenaei]|uniref:Serine hydrolase domain-containing protein n=1 Tax=Pseudoalteromonas fenneropenaei TaxID=1737459 RepID=A0ABV7CC60_9GAMM